LVAFDAPQLPSGSREPDAALGGSTSSKLTCREKQRKSGNIAVISPSSLALGCAGLPHPRLVAGARWRGSSRRPPRLPRSVGWHA